MPVLIHPKPVGQLQIIAKTVQDEYGLGDQKSQVICVTDISGSMSGLFSSGIMDGLITNVAALGLNLDDDGQVPSIALGTGARQLPNITRENVQSYVANHLKRLVGGGTSYAPSINKVLDLVTPGDPALVLFFTDGDTDDASKTEDAQSGWRVTTRSSGSSSASIPAVQHHSLF